MMDRHHRLTVYSCYPYSTDETLASRYRRAKSFFYVFKNGRAYKWGRSRKTFRQIVQSIVEKATKCPVFASPCVVVPVPRSGSSRKSFEAGACDFPCGALARALTSIDGITAAELLVREHAVPRASETDGRVSVNEHRASLAVSWRPELSGSRIVLLDDVVTRGTQLIACALELRSAGYGGTIEAFCLSQAVARKPRMEQLQPYLIHQVVWGEGHALASREDGEQWRPARWSPTSEG